MLYQSMHLLNRLMLDLKNDPAGAAERAQTVYWQEYQELLAEYRKAQVFFHAAIVDSAESPRTTEF